ncbi:hypothetical protein JCM21900_004673 [Sporobolomyces salmonicolor]
MSTIAHTEAHAGAGDLGEGYKAPQGGPRYEEGAANSHKNLDSTDERSIANRLAAASKADEEEKKAEKEGGAAPTAAARAHGNEPSKGAKIDEELQKEEEQELKNKGKA